MIWQNITIAIVVTAATIYIAVQIWKTLYRKTSACCEKGCASKQQVVQIALGSSARNEIERN